jgi:beta-glucosidase
MRGRTYRYFTGKPLYPFGYGLSYSDFGYSNFQIDGANVRVTVTNKSKRDGEEVVQLYATPAASSTGQIRQLVGFQRLHLKPGEVRVVTFTRPTGVPNTVKLSAGGGQPVEEWTAGHYVEAQP